MTWPSSLDCIKKLIGWPASNLLILANQVWRYNWNNCSIVTSNLVGQNLPVDSRLSAGNRQFFLYNWAQFELSQQNYSSELLAHHWFLFRRRHSETPLLNDVSLNTACKTYHIYQLFSKLNITREIITCVMRYSIWKDTLFCYSKTKLANLYFFYYYCCCSFCFCSIFY